MVPDASGPDPGSSNRARVILASVTGTLVAVALVWATLAATVGVHLGTPAPSATTRATPRPSPVACSNPSRDLYIATGVAGAPNPADPRFVADQTGLFDPFQFADSNSYLPGYHWKIDPAFSPLDVTSLTPVPATPQDARAVEVTFNAAGAARVKADTTAAWALPSDSPANHVAFFSGTEVLSAPGVRSPVTGSTLELILPPLLHDGRSAKDVTRDIC